LYFFRLLKLYHIFVAVSNYILPILLETGKIFDLRLKKKGGIKPAPIF